MTGLNDAAANLVLSLELAEQELQSVSYRLGDEFSRRATNTQANPAHVLKRLAEVER